MTANVEQVLSKLSPEELALLKAAYQAGIKTPTAILNATKTAQLSILEFGETEFYIPETGQPLVWVPVQRVLLPIIAGTHNYPALLPFYSTVYWSTIKKTAKTSTSGSYARWRAEAATLNDEILFFANDEAQSRGRAYEAITKSIELNPRYDKVKRVLYDRDGNAVWRIIADYLEHIPTRTRVKAVNVDYRGEAGANPTLSVWTEVWGYDSDKQEKLFDEMTDVLTRERSQRYLEGYAGYVGRSKIQKKVEDLLVEPGRGGRQLSLKDIPDWPGVEREQLGDRAPDQIQLPVYVNDAAGVFGFIDRNEIARTRWPWCQGPEAEAYYHRQAITLTPEQYDRLHLNHWVSPVTAFLPIEWHAACADPTVPILTPWRRPVSITEPPRLGERDSEGRDLLALYMAPSNWEIVGPPQAVVLSVDASVAGDCTALSAFTRHPTRHQDVVHRRAYKWDPPKGGKLDYNYTPNARTGYSLVQQTVKLCMEYNVVQLSYDEWQLHHMMNELRQQELTWCKPFSQATARDVADKQLYDLIKEKRYSYNPDEPELDLVSVRSHIQNAARKQRAGEDTKLHIIKASDEGKIDLVITMSMGTAETLRLDL
jgi:hypothetical protein